MIKKLVAYSLLICMLMFSMPTFAEEVELAPIADEPTDSGYEVLIDLDFDDIELGEDEYLPYFLNQELEERTGSCVQQRRVGGNANYVTDADPTPGAPWSGNPITDANYDPTDTIEIVDGKLKISKSDKTRYHSLVFGLKEGCMTYEQAAAEQGRIDSGILRLSADISFDDSDGIPDGTHRFSTVPFIMFSTFDRGHVVGVNNNGGAVYVRAETNYQNKVTWNTDDVNHVELFVDFGSNTTWGVVNGRETVRETPAANYVSFVAFQLESFHATPGYYIDNLKVERFGSPQVLAASFDDGNTDDVMPGDEISFTLSQPVNPESVSNVELYVNDVKEEVPEFDISSDGKKITLRNELQYSAAYKIVIGDKVTDIDIASGETFNFSFPETIYTFNTTHKPITITSPEEIVIVNEYTDADGNPADFATATAVTKKATIEAAEESTVTMIVVAYGEGGNIKSVSNYQTITIPAGESKDFSVKIDLPEGTTEDNIKTFFWEDFKTIRSYNTKTAG